MIERRSGTLRSEQQLPDLLNSPFQIDQRSFWDIMGYVVNYLQKINYFQFDNQVDGNWKTLVESDPVIYMVIIINEPLTNIEQFIQDQSIGSTVDAKDNVEVVNMLLGWYTKIDTWYKTLLIMGEQRLAYKINNILVDVLNYQRNALLKYKGSGYKESSAEQSGLEFLPEPPDMDVTAESLGKILHTFQRVIIHIQAFTKSYLEKNLTARNDHVPNNAMYIAFALLFETVQNNINTLSKRHLDFYYKDILQQKNKPGEPTRTVISVDLLPNISSSLLESGALLSAGKLFGSKSDVLFATEKPLVIYPLELIEMQTLLFNANPYLKIGTDQELVTSIQVNDLISKGKDVLPRDEWLVFGADRQIVESAQIVPEKTANVGFIIGSPVLDLKNGRRCITVQINFEEQTAKNVFWKLIQQISTNRKLSLDTVLFEVFNEGLRVAYTTVKGWKPFANYAIDYNEADNYLSIDLVLESGDPALAKYPGSIEQLTWPAIKVEFNEYAPVYLYSFFRGVEVDSIDINVDVSNIKDLALYNNVGKMSAGKAFDLFGPVPEKGGYLLIGNKELFEKQVNALEIQLNWESLPQDFGGLTTYYSGYSVDINNTSFKVQLNALTNGYWLPDQPVDVPIVDLFSTEPCLTPEGYQSERLSSVTKIAFKEFEAMNISRDYNLPDPLNYTVDTQSGFIRLKLVDPEYGFGSRLYPNEYTEIASFNAKNKTQIPYPNQPLVPKISGVTMNYKATDTLFFSKDLSRSTAMGLNTGQYIHITPFGYEDTIVGGNVRNHKLICDFESQGYLFLGLKGVDTNTTATIYFHFWRTDMAIEIKKSALKWEYFQYNQWHPFGEGDIIQDETDGFIKSGIVELILPKAEVIGGTTTNLYWIRISVTSGAQNYPKIKGVYLNAVRAVCTSSTPDVMGKVIPAGSISKLAGKYPDIKKVVQPSESNGGVIAETDEVYYNRVSERLRHKSRAVSIWDYERLILEHFNDVRVVKATSFDQNFKQQPGKVTVVVLGERWKEQEHYYFNENVLSNMKSFLMKHANPFVQIQVMNPVVEYLLVNCVVELMPEDNGGYYLNQLNKTISSFLSPVSKTRNGVGGIGGSVVPTMLVSHLENLSYIKQIVKLTIEHIVSIKGRNKYSLGVFEGGEEIKTTTPWSILVPVAQQHIVSIINPDQQHNTLDTGIGNMEIGLDLIIGDVKDAEPVVLNEDTADNDQKVLEDDAILIIKNKS